MIADDGQLTVRVQLLDRIGYPPWPTKLRTIEQRYSDAALATLRTRTAPSFAAWKTVAWHERRTARDLWDLWALACEGKIDEHAALLFATHGPTGRPPQPWMFTAAPSGDRWHAQLAAQTRLTVGSVDALDLVATAWARAIDKLAQ